jgi:Flp pilus assembly protein TadG
MAMARIKPRSQAPERGTTTVEAAIILLAFLMSIFAVFEAGRFINTYQVLTNAAREGARLAVTPLYGTNTLPPTSEIQDRVNQFLSSGNISGATTTVNPAVSVVTGSVTTTYTQVTVQLPYQVITVPSFFNALNVTLTGEALMRNETSE